MLTKVKQPFTLTQKTIMGFMMVLSTPALADVQGDLLTKAGITSQNSTKSVDTALVDIGAQGLSAGSIIAAVIGLCIFIAGVVAMRDERTRMQGVWGIIVGGILAVAGLAYGFSGGFLKNAMGL